MPDARAEPSTIRKFRDVRVVAQIGRTLCLDGVGSGGALGDIGLSELESTGRSQAFAWRPRRVSCR
jgi:hypothetical protein